MTEIDYRRNKVKISGETVNVALSLSISGQQVAISGTVDARVSGQTVVAEISGQPVQVSGQAVRVSGETVKAEISGQRVRIQDAAGTDITAISIGGQAFLRVIVSGQPVSVSGQTVSIDTVSISGLNVVATIVTNVSGNAVRISGEAVKVSGQTIISEISGQTVVAKVSGEAVRISGQTVNISGQFVQIYDGTAGEGLEILGSTTTDGLGLNKNAAVTATFLHGFDRLSGWTRVQVRGSGQGYLLVDVSGQPVGVSGQAVRISGEAVKISGETVIANISGGAVKISGETVSVSGIVQTRTPTSILTGNEVVVASVSGGTELGSGVCATVTVRAHVSASGLYWVGGSAGAFVPNSGKGFQLARGDGKTYMIDNINRIRVFAAVSGDRVSYDATAY